MSEEVLLQKAFPIVEGIPEQLFAELEENKFKDFIPAEKNLAYITTCEKVRKDEIEKFQKEMFKGLEQFGYPLKELKQKDSENAKIDRWIGKFLYEKMNITPSVAATLGMWQFMNLYVFPSVVYWRWGDAKHRYISSVRNYCGTMWWRQYFFTQSPELEKMYIFLTEDEIVSLYERTRTRGLPEHIRNNVIWYQEFCKKYSVTKKEFYREVIKSYNTELGFRNYYALTQDDLHQIYEQAFVSCLSENEQKIVNSSKAETEPKKKIIITETHNNNYINSSSTEQIEKNNDVEKTVINYSDEKRTLKVKPEDLIFSDDTVLIVKNKERNLIEITFEKLPKQDIKVQMRVIGFKYLGMERKWVVQDTPKVMNGLKKVFKF